VASRARWQVVVTAWLLAIVAPVAVRGGGHGRHGHHQGCRHGQCVPHCPVKPGQFGYHGTEWRRWPGTGVVPVSAVSDAVPVRPPRSVVPGADEESPRRTDDEADADGATAPDAAPPVFELPAEPQSDDGASLAPPRPLFGPASGEPREPGGEKPRGWRGLLDDVATPVAETSPDAGAGDPPVAAAQHGGQTVAPVAFYPPRPPLRPAAQPAGGIPDDAGGGALRAAARPQRAAAVRGR
jgi:hypothetical protein